MDEGHGEALFDVGLEDSGASMGFGRAEWATALVRLRAAAEAAKADMRVLLTRNVGDGPEEAGPLQGGKDVSASGKVMIRRRPETIEDVIETRIAVVGNGQWPR